MGNLNKEQKKRFNDLVINENIFETVNGIFKMHGVDIQLASLKVQPVDTNKGSFNHNVMETKGKRNWNVFPPLCEHGKEMINVCKGGSCQWECNHEDKDAII